MGGPRRSQAKSVDYRENYGKWEGAGSRVSNCRAAVSLWEPVRRRDDEEAAEYRGDQGFKQAEG